MGDISEPAKLLLLISQLSKERIISNNGKSFLKEMVLRRDNKLDSIMSRFDRYSAGDATFLEQINELIRMESEATYNELFVDTSLEMGKSLSKDERDRRNLNEDKSLIYGEVEYKSFFRILRKLNPEPGLTFYDLGSGTGKAVFAARLTQDFGKCIGIEILEGLHNQAFGITHKYNTHFRQVLCSSQRQHAAVYMGSFLEFDWRDGDVVFANSTCFDDDLMTAMSKMAHNLKPGAIVVTFTKGLEPADGFELLEKKREKMSWGPATVFIHRRLNLNGTPVGPSNLYTLPSDRIEYEDDGADEDDEDDDEDEDEDEDEEEEDEEDEEEEEDEDEDEDEEDEDEDEEDDEVNTTHKLFKNLIYNNIAAHTTTQHTLKYLLHTPTG